MNLNPWNKICQILFIFFLQKMLMNFFKHSDFLEWRRRMREVYVTNTLFVLWWQTRYYSKDLPCHVSINHLTVTHKKTAFLWKKFYTFFFKSRYFIWERKTFLHKNTLAKDAHFLCFQRKLKRTWILLLVAYIILPYARLSKRRLLFLHYFFKGS